jgi:hypothetical protein
VRICGGAKLGGANLHGAVLDGANLSGADFTLGSNGKPLSARGLTAGQLANATFDEATRLPTEVAENLVRYHRQQLYYALVHRQNRLSSGS